MAGPGKSRAQWLELVTKMTGSVTPSRAHAGLGQALDTEGGLMALQLRVTASRAGFLSGRGDCSKIEAR